MKGSGTTAVAREREGKFAHRSNLDNLWAARPAFGRRRAPGDGGCVELLHKNYEVRDEAD
jgi:hypothetical protein